MKSIAEIHPDKLRGGFYTKPHVVAFCLSQINKLYGGWPKRWLEPSAGDGAFIRGMEAAIPEDARRSTSLLAVELVPEEAYKCNESASQASFVTRIVNDSFFNWATSCSHMFDAVIGNPPFVRYQFVSDHDRSLAEQLVAKLDIELRGVSNLWIPFALVSLARLRDGGCFSLVLPSELFCTSSGGQFRSYILTNFASIEIDLFPRGTFSDILQDVVVVSGRKVARKANSRCVQLTEHAPRERVSWSHKFPASAESWTRFLLSENEHAAFSEAATIPDFHQLGTLAKIEVAIVTGANSFFTVPDEVVTEYQLKRWAVPLLARTSDAPGLVFTDTDHREARKRGSRAWLLDFSADRPEPNGNGRVIEYLKTGEAQRLPTRYKCRIRNPWYRVPHVKKGTLMMTKRAHLYHRLLLNEGNAYTTDTIYRGEVLPLFKGRQRDVVAGFQNTLTLLSSEVEGRTYGGGVLELVPSEVSRLMVPLVPTGSLLKRLDQLSRKVNGQKDSTHAVMQVTDAFLCRAYVDYRRLLPQLDNARRKLLAKRHALSGEEALDEEC